MLFIELPKVWRQNDTGITNERTMKELRDKVIAVVGVSHRPEKYGYKIFRDLYNAGYRVHGVYVRGGEVLGQKMHKTIKDIGIVPDMVITVVPFEVTERIIEECKILGIKEIWMQPGSESPAAIEKAKSYGISVTHNACIMIDKGMW